MNIDEQIAVLQAYKDGKTIVGKNKYGQKYSVNIEDEGGDHLFDFYSYIYAVEPVQREFWVVDVQGKSRLLCSTRAEAVEADKAYKSGGHASEIIHVREVTGE